MNGNESEIIRSSYKSINSKKLSNDLNNKNSTKSNSNLNEEKANNQKQKNKMIEDCTQDDKIEIIEEDKIDIGKQSTLLSLCKEKLNEMKKNYKDKCLENEFLKQDMKITKIKEIQIENDVFKKQKRKIRDKSKRTRTLPSMCEIF